MFGACFEVGSLLAATKRLMLTRRAWRTQAVWVGTWLYGPSQRDAGRSSLPRCRNSHMSSSFLHKRHEPVCAQFQMALGMRDGLKVALHAQAFDTGQGLDLENVVCSCSGTHVCVSVLLSCQAFLYNACFVSLVRAWKE